MCQERKKEEQKSYFGSRVSNAFQIPHKLIILFQFHSYPLYATTAPDEPESEEILTYEEVALYYPRDTHKRPIVLIGPPNIGRHELRQRLMADSDRFAAAVPRKYF